jgi:hypothetical protein
MENKMLNMLETIMRYVIPLILILFCIVFYLFFLANTTRIHIILGKIEARVERLDTVSKMSDKDKTSKSWNLPITVNFKETIQPACPSNLLSPANKRYCAENKELPCHQQCLDQPYCCVLDENPEKSF